MKLTLTYTITVTQVIDDTSECGYEFPEDPIECAEQEEEWIKSGDIALEDMDFSNAVTTVIGEAS